MREKLIFGLLIFGPFLLAGCATYARRSPEPHRVEELEKEYARLQPVLSSETRDRILALDPQHVTDRDVRDVLSQAPAPRIINIHGGVFPVHRRMISFSEFLVGMGYPRSSITNPGDGTYTFSCYESTEKVAGVIAWYYEKEGLRPVIVGHSQGGFQVLKILHTLAGHSTTQIEVWNPLTWRPENRCEITDPLTGQARSVVGLQLAYATAVGSGGLTRLLPNQWSIDSKLRSVPDSVEEFTGFYKHLDLLGGDFLGYGSANLYKSDGKAVVRTVRLPTRYRHGWIPDTEHLLKDQNIVEWINDFTPPDTPVSAPSLDVTFESRSANILWAADVWFSIKKHWVLELQRVIRAKRALRQPAK